MCFRSGCRRCARASKTFRPCEALCPDFWPPDGQTNRTHSSRNNVCAQLVPVARKCPRVTEPDRTCRDPFKRWRASRSFAHDMDTRCLRSFPYSEGHRTLADSAYVGIRRLGDRRRERRSRQTWLEAHDADQQDAEAGDFPASFPE
jgi:hypothetical protein